MGTPSTDGARQFNEAELASITMLFHRLNQRNIAPVMLYCVNADGLPVAAFNPMFEVIEADLIGGVVAAVLQYLNDRHTPR